MMSSTTRRCACRVCLTFALLVLFATAQARGDAHCLSRQTVLHKEDLKQASGCKGAVATMRGYHRSGDGGGGRFRWAAAGAFTEGDGGIVFPAGTDGWWVRQRVRDDVVNVRSFGVRGDGAEVPKINARAFNEAVASLEDGGVVEVPGPAVYVVGGTQSSIHLADDVSLRGTGGMQVAELKAPKTGANDIVYIGEDVEDTVVENLKFDLRSVEDFERGIYQKGTGSLIRGNRFYDSTMELGEDDPRYTGDKNWTRMAIQNRGAGVRVIENSFRGVQAKMAGGPGRMTDIDVLRNRFINSQAYGVSLVSSADDVVIENVRIQDNYLYNFSRGGIFIGGDKGQSRDAQPRFGNIEVSSNNLVIGPQLQRFDAGIVIRPLGEGRNVRIHDNRIECFEDASDFGSGKLLLIAVKADSSGAVLNGLSITGNELRADRRVSHAIRVRSEATQDLVVFNNKIVSPSRGVRIEPENDGVILRENHIMSSGYALRLAQSRRFEIVGNTFVHAGQRDRGASVEVIGPASGALRDNRVRGRDGSARLATGFRLEGKAPLRLSMSGNRVAGAERAVADEVRRR